MRASGGARAVVSATNEFRESKRGAQLRQASGLMGDGLTGIFGAIVVGLAACGRCRGRAVAVFAYRPGAADLSLPGAGGRPDGCPASFGCASAAGQPTGVGAPNGRIRIVRLWPARPRSVTGVHQVTASGSPNTGVALVPEFQRPARADYRFCAPGRWLHHASPVLGWAASGSGTRGGRGGDHDRVGRGHDRRLLRFRLRPGRRHCRYPAQRGCAALARPDQARSRCRPRAATGAGSAAW